MTLQNLLKDFLDLKIESAHQNIEVATGITPESSKHFEQLLLNKPSAMNWIQT
jgi:hypothetical protein